jgi:hypothetical protein
MTLVAEIAGTPPQDNEGDAGSTENASSSTA